MSYKDTKGKPRLSLVPNKAMIEIAKVREFGVKKYGDDKGWKQVTKNEFIDATLRHIFSHLDGVTIDRESSLDHLSHALTSLALAVSVQDVKSDRNSNYKKVKFNEETLSYDKAEHKSTFRLPRNHGSPSERAKAAEETKRENFRGVYRDPDSDWSIL